jgi:hypothetical protein
MMFNAKSVFSRRPSQEQDEGAGLPSPKRLRLKARRAAGIAEGRQILAMLPGPGESVHTVLTARIDVATLLDLLLAQMGRCDELAIATLGYSSRNLTTMLRWLDTGMVGKLWLVSSLFFRSHEKELWETTQEEFRRRGQRACCCPSHAKVVTMRFATGVTMVAEGSGNLRSNGSARENLTLINDAEIHDWHQQWITALVQQHGGQASK